MMLFNPEEYNYKSINELVDVINNKLLKTHTEKIKAQTILLSKDNRFLSDNMNKRPIVFHVRVSR